MKANSYVARGQLLKSFRQSDQVPAGTTPLRPLLGQDLLSHLLIHPANENHRPPEVAPRPSMSPALATAQGLCQRLQDSRNGLSFILLIGERNLVVITDRQTELLEFIAAT